MINAFYSATSGATGYQNGLNVTANNIANADTAGFKAQRAAFTDLIYTNLPGEEQNLQKGNGMRVSAISSALAPGNIQQTDRSLDVALNSDGYFCVSDGAGNITYTRAGNFQISTYGGRNYLVTADGDFVLDQNLQPAVVPDAAQAAFGAPVQAPAAGDGTVRLAVVTFDNPYALTRDGGGRLTAGPNAGAVRMNYDAGLLQGSLEGSNVSLVDEMTRLIESQRGFQMSAKVIQTSDEMEQIANNLR